MALKFSIHPSFHSFPIEMGDPAWRWGNMFAVLDIGVRKGFRFSTYLWVSCIRLLPGSITWGKFVTGFLLLHGVLTLI